MENREIYYMCRQISSQYGTVFHHSHYEDMVKVYSIWFCTSPPNYKQNTITGISMKHDFLYGQYDSSKLADVDFMQGMIINLGDYRSETDCKILHLMNTLLSDEASVTEKREILTRDFDMKITKELESEVYDMCNLSQGIKAKGHAKGLSQGMAQGRLENQIEISKNLLALGMDYDLIAKAVNVSVEKIREWLA